MGAIGVVTIALPLMGAVPMTGADGAAAVARADEAVAQHQEDELLSGVNFLSGQADLQETVGATEIPDALKFQQDDEISALAEKSSRSIESRAVEIPVDPLPGCDGTKRVSGSNGKLPASDLCSLWTGASSFQLRADAAVALATLNQKYVEDFGKSMCVSSGYRSYAQQASMHSSNSSMVAPAGQSNHGWGLAVDLCGGIDSAGTKQWKWMAENGPALGWDNPGWARSGGIGPYEPWHWEFEGGAISYG